MQDRGLALIIPTYRRPRLLRRLLEDVSRQTLQPRLLIVIDGDPRTGLTRDLLDGCAALRHAVLYVPSNHANLPYQRYLGWRASEGFERIAYLDDDLRIPTPVSFEELLRPLLQCWRGVAGVTAEIEFPQDSKKVSATRRRCRQWKVLGLAGSLTPLGTRIPPHPGSSAYAAVGWLRGGVMAFGRRSLDEGCFSSCMMALAEAGLGLGEDTLLALRVRARGELLLARRALFTHPSSDVTRSVDCEPRRRSFAEALSRRLLHQNRRYPGRPAALETLAFQAALARALLQKLSAALRAADRSGWSAAKGYAEGLLASPPGAVEADWRAQAAEALAAARPIGAIPCRTATHC